ncbi:expressed unknown protein [Seminavis robusta]|uniref:C2H2-type domain-containing protein n=1 Tax=Seminavis robusta TaxID=568900 RepID=A0A9N8H2L9_9STRA|nr:expressed unknown protein [Seminavis robusta]|eukprot:Sro39_g024210.1 n/a (1459) ;mRNA; f:97343-101719
MDPTTAHELEEVDSSNKENEHHVVVAKMRDSDSRSPRSPTLARRILQHVKAGTLAKSTYPMPPSATRVKIRRKLRKKRHSGEMPGSEEDTVQSPSKRRRLSPDRDKTEETKEATKEADEPEAEKEAEEDDDSSKDDTANQKPAAVANKETVANKGTDHPKQNTGTPKVRRRVRRGQPDTWLQARNKAKALESQKNGSSSKDLTKKKPAASVNKETDQQNTGPPKGRRNKPHNNDNAVESQENVASSKELTNKEPAAGKETDAHKANPTCKTVEPEEGKPTEESPKKDMDTVEEVLDGDTSSDSVLGTTYLKDNSNDISFNLSKSSAESSKKSNKYISGSSTDSKDNSAQEEEMQCSPAKDVSSRLGTSIDLEKSPIVAGPPLRLSDISAITQADEDGDDDADKPNVLSSKSEASLRREQERLAKERQQNHNKNGDKTDSSHDKDSMETAQSPQSRRRSRSRDLDLMPRSPNPRPLQRSKTDSAVARPPAREPDPPRYPLRSHSTNNVARKDSAPVLPVRRPPVDTTALKTARQRRHPRRPVDAAELQAAKLNLVTGRSRPRCRKLMAGGKTGTSTAGSATSAGAESKDTEPTSTTGIAGGKVGTASASDETVSPATGKSATSAGTESKEAEPTPTSAGGKAGRTSVSGDATAGASGMAGGKTGSASASDKSATSARAGNSPSTGKSDTSAGAESKETEVAPTVAGGHAGNSKEAEPTSTMAGGAGGKAGSASVSGETTAGASSGNDNSNQLGGLVLEKNDKEAGPTPTTAGGKAGSALLSHKTKEAEPTPTEAEAELIPTMDDDDDEDSEPAASETSDKADNSNPASGDSEKESALSPKKMAGASVATAATGGLTDTNNKSSKVLAMDDDNNDGAGDNTATKKAEAIRGGKTGSTLLSNETKEAEPTATTMGGGTAGSSSCGDKTKEAEPTSGTGRGKGNAGDNKHVCPARCGKRFESQAKLDEHLLAVAGAKRSGKPNQHWKIAEARGLMISTKATKKKLQLRSVESLRDQLKLGTLMKDAVDELNCDLSIDNLGALSKANRDELEQMMNMRADLLRLLKAQEKGEIDPPLSEEEIKNMQIDHITAKIENLANLAMDGWSVHDTRKNHPNSIVSAAQQPQFVPPEENLKDGSGHIRAIFSVQGVTKSPGYNCLTDTINTILGKRVLKVDQVKQEIRSQAKKPGRRSAKTNALVTVTRLENLAVVLPKLTNGDCMLVSMFQPQAKSPDHPDGKTPAQLQRRKAEIKEDFMSAPPRFGVLFSYKQGCYIASASLFDAAGKEHGHCFSYNAGASAVCDGTFKTAHTISDEDRQNFSEDDWNQKLCADYGDHIKCIELKCVYQVRVKFDSVVKGKYPHFIGWEKYGKDAGNSMTLWRAQACSKVLRGLQGWNDDDDDDDDDDEPTQWVCSAGCGEKFRSQEDEKKHIKEMAAKSRSSATKHAQRWASIEWLEKTLEDYQAR